MNSSPQLIVIAGPTAAGKSDLAQQLALERKGEILNFDSQQFYRGLEIGTGKVPLQEQKVRHWFLEVVKPGEFMSAMDFVRLAEPVIEKLHQENKLPILVGGTGLYLRALLEGLDVLPSRNSEIRFQLEQHAIQQGVASLHHRLEQVDPKRASQIMPQDQVRLIRALEIYQLTGQPPSQLLTQNRPEHLRYRTETHWLIPPREKLKRRIAKRVEQMFAAGWVTEVEGLLKKGQDPRAWSHRPIGYADIAEAIERPRKDKAELIQKIIIKTRQYAKRQETFFRGLFAAPAYQTQDSCLILRENISG